MDAQKMYDSYNDLDMEDGNKRDDLNPLRVAEFLVCLALRMSCLTLAAVLVVNAFKAMDSNFWVVIYCFLATVCFLISRVPSMIVNQRIYASLNKLHQRLAREEARNTRRHAPSDSPS